MNRFTLLGVATAAAAAAIALPAPAFAQDNAEAERAFSRAARGFTACLAQAATEDAAASLDGRCLAQETAYRASGIRLRVARGAASQVAVSETEADIADGRRSFGAVQSRQLASR